MLAGCLVVKFLGEEGDPGKKEVEPKKKGKYKMACISVMMASLAIARKP